MKAVDKKTWILSGVMLVVIILTTWLLRIDIPYAGDPARNMTAGYVTLGDVGIYVSVMLLGGPLAALVSAVGAMLADIIAGHGGYALATFVIKGLMALLAARQLKRADTLMQRVKALLIAGGFMMIGYFLFDLVVRGDYFIAAIGLPFNILQVLACGMIATLVLFLTQGKAYSKGDAAQKTHTSGTSKRNLK